MRKNGDGFNREVVKIGEVICSGRRLHPFTRGARWKRSAEVTSPRLFGKVAGSWLSCRSLVPQHASLQREVSGNWLAPCIVAQCQPTVACTRRWQLLQSTRTDTGTAAPRGRSYRVHCVRPIDIATSLPVCFWLAAVQRSRAVIIKCTMLITFMSYIYLCVQ